MTTWLVILAVAAGTYALRASMFVALGDREVPTWAASALALVAPAAVAALTASMLFTTSGRIEAAPVAEVAAVVAAVLVVRRTGNVMHAFALGLPVFWIVGAIG